MCGTKPDSSGCARCWLTYEFSRRQISFDNFAKSTVN
jgi:hypothetical protein